MAYVFLKLLDDMVNSNAQIITVKLKGVIGEKLVRLNSARQMSEVERVSVLPESIRIESVIRFQNVGLVAVQVRIAT